ncbi:GIY-YIG nuclease family protein [Synechococcus sp. ATX 2A4]|uniref:GIY-YIG nuclease family protein n=1 Tax=Synechococcus sp. ATX 2A4 TaxID=2823727 RepID=UPI0020CEC981|nr:GIY-YIG nuclease family protein [Synechococcus sp. ATX 2A4]
MGLPRQGQLNLFGAGSPSPASEQAPSDLPLARHQLLRWQQGLADFQRPLHRSRAGVAQRSLFGASGADAAAEQAAGFDPLALAPLNLQFWRWPEPPQQGAALYVVMDRQAQLEHPLLLYVGETGCADRRWKGEHDCKTYLAAYDEALRRCGLASGLSIRFCSDVPGAVKPRRALEQALIRRWQPPFNKETRQRWATPFTADPA